MPRTLRTLLSFGFWFPIDAIINRWHGWSFSDTLLLYRISYRIERTGHMF